MTDKPERTVVRILNALQFAGMQIPPVLARLIDGAAPQPLVIGSHKVMDEWATAQGYSNQQRKKLRCVISALSRSEMYLQALSAPGAIRVDLTGAPIEPVSEEHRAFAVETLQAREAAKEVEADKVRHAAPRAAEPSPKTPAPSPPPLSVVTSSKGRAATVVVQKWPRLSPAELRRRAAAASRQGR